MKRTVAFRVLAVALLSVALGSVVALASERYVCTIAATSSAGPWNTSNVFDGGTACTWAAGSSLRVQCTQDSYVEVKPDGGSASTAAGVKLTADQLYPVNLRQNEKHFGVLASSTSGTCRFFTALDY